MAGQGGFAGEASFYRDHVRPAADFVVNHGPAVGVERWEEHPGYSPSTIGGDRRAGRGLAAGRGSG